MGIVTGILRTGAKTSAVYSGGFVAGELLVPAGGSALGLLSAASYLGYKVARPVIKTAAGVGQTLSRLA